MEQDNEIEKMSDGEFYTSMLFVPHDKWAQECNKKMGLNLTDDQIDTLGIWFANAQMAVIDRSAVGYIEARIESEAQGDNQ